MKAIIISAFPAVGKSYLYDNQDKLGLKVSDSDSSKFSWIPNSNPKERNPNFPTNYINHIKEIQPNYDLVLVSSHKNVRDSLMENNMKFIIVYPSKEVKEVYMKRYKQRGNDQSFIDMMDKNFESFVDEIDQIDSPLVKKIKLTTDKYLADVIKI